MPYKVKFDYFDYLVYPSWDVPTRVHPDMVKEVGHFSINVLWEERYLDFSVIFKAKATHCSQKQKHSSKIQNVINFFRIDFFRQDRS